MKALDALKMALGNTNPAADSDLGVSALCLKTALQGAWLNILSNLDGIRDDAFIEKYRSQGEELLRRGLSLADSIYLR